MSKFYRNRLVINQKGGSILIDNTTNQQKIKLSQRGGGNISIENNLNSEMAPVNKQLLVLHDNYKSVGGDDSEFVGRDKTDKVGENKYILNGFISQAQLDAFKTWRELNRNISKENSKFKVRRGGLSYPNGVEIPQSGSRGKNPTLGNVIVSVNNTTSGVVGVPVRSSNVDEVTKYTKVPNRQTVGASKKSPNVTEITASGGVNGSSAPGIIEYGANISASTEAGSWETETTDIKKQLVDLQETLLPVEEEMGNGGDEIQLHKRNKFTQVGATFNDFPSIRIDPKGRSHPLEIIVGPINGTFKNFDYVPHVEEVDNSSTFPCGNDDQIIGNRLSRVVGSGGISLKTTGGIELGGTTMKLAANALSIDGYSGVSIASKNNVDIRSDKALTIRSTRQILLDGPVGIHKNLITNGSTYTEGEVFLHHITAPAEVQQTYDTVVTGKFATDTDRTLVIGEVKIANTYFDVYAKATNDLIINYPHSHQFLNAPMRLTDSNKTVRALAHLEGINKHTTITQALPQLHERKKIYRIS